MAFATYQHSGTRFHAAVFLTVLLGALVFPTAIAGADAPANDLVADSIVVDPNGLPFSDTVDTTEATTDGDDAEVGCPAPATDASVWYSITPTSDALLAVGADRSDYSVGITVTTGDPGSFELIECRPFPFVVRAKAGVTYRFQVFDGQEDRAGNGGNLEFTLQEPQVVIDTEVKFSDSERPSGTFTVLGGSDVMGCESGSFVDPAFFDNEVTKIFTCDSGERSGTLSVSFRPSEFLDTDEYGSGTWEVKEGTGGFDGVTGGGDFVITYDESDPNVAIERFTGTLDVPLTQTDLAVTGSNTATLVALASFMIAVGFVFTRARRDEAR